MPKSERTMIQIRLTDAHRRRIKSLAAKQGLTLQDAVVEAFAAWAEKLRTPARASQAKPSTPPELEHPPERSWAWLTRAVQLDWAKCPEVELLEDGTNQLWMLRDSDAPLSEVLGAVADGNPVPEVAQIFDLEPRHLEKVLEFANVAQ